MPQRKSRAGLFRRSSLFRGFLFLFILAAGVCGAVIAHHASRRRPYIDNVSPRVALPGATLTIEGRDFGDGRGSSYVEIGHSRLTHASYRAWSDGRIVLTVPGNAEAGLVFVGTARGKSNAAFFAIARDVPAEPSREETVSPAPFIASIAPEAASPGQRITISGRNFGSSRGEGVVYFAANREGLGDALPHPRPGSVASQDDARDFFISASALEGDYVSWSDSEIVVRVPDGAAGGPVFVRTAQGASNAHDIALSFPLGRKQYTDRRVYVVQCAADISNLISEQESSILLYMPKPCVYSFQPSVELIDIFPEPLIANDAYDTIYRTRLDHLANNSQRFSQTFAVTVYAVRGNIDGRPTGSVDAAPAAYTLPDPCVPSDAPYVADLLAQIAPSADNPLAAARTVYDYLAENYTIISGVRGSSSSIENLVRTGSGDAYDFAMLYTALLRAAKIPAVPVSGILVYSSSASRPHWWTEIYFEGYGYLPVDVALGAGLPFTPFIEIEDTKSFYFGNIDNQHIAFSRGWNRIRRTASDSKVVYRPKTYALQSVWEEAGNATSSYSSLWNNPMIRGIY